MIKSAKIILCLILVFSLTVSILLCGCKEESNSSAVSAETTLKPTEPQTTVSAATEDSPTQPATWNYSRIKIDSDKLKNKFDSIINTYKFRGTVYVKIGNDFEYIGTNGFSDKNKHTDNSLDTCYRVASITKQFTAAAVMQLNEQGKLSLDDSLDKYYPSYKYGKKITITNLLNMTSGLKDYLSDQYNYVKVTADNSAKENKKLIMDWIFDQKLAFEPGSQYAYTSSGYYLLGDIIEKASGVSYEKYITKNILKPCAMTSSGFKENKNLAKGYQDIYDSEWTLYPGVAYSAAGLISNVPDLLKWIDALGENTIISEESIEAMTTPGMGNYGFGLFIDGNLIYHTGKIDKYNSLVGFSKNQNQIVITLSNYAQSEPSKISRHFTDVLNSYYG